MTSILAIAGDAAVRLALRRMLGDAGFSVSAAADRAGGLTLCRIVQPDLVIAEVTCEAADTSDFRAGLRRAYPKARLLALSDGTAIGIAALRQPFTHSELLAAVRRCLAHPAAPRRRGRAR